MAKLPPYLKDHADDIEAAQKWYNACYEFRAEGGDPVDTWIKLWQRHKLWPTVLPYKVSFVPKHFGVPAENPDAVSKLFNVPAKHLGGFFLQLSEATKGRLGLPVPKMGSEERPLILSEDEEEDVVTAPHGARLRACGR